MSQMLHTLLANMVAINQTTRTKKPRQLKNNNNKQGTQLSSHGGRVCSCFSAFWSSSCVVTLGNFVTCCATFGPIVAQHARAKPSHEPRKRCATCAALGVAGDRDVRRNISVQLDSWVQPPKNQSVSPETFFFCHGPFLLDLRGAQPDPHV